MINFLHTYLPQSILLQLGPLSIHWYGLFVSLGILAGIVVASRLARTYHISSEKMYDVGLYAALGGLVGARLYAVLLELPYYLARPAEIIAVWHGGLAIHGGIIGAIITLIFYCKKNSISFWNVADAAAPALALGQAIGRFGNYFNQEIFGTPTNLPWGIPIAPENRPEAYASFTYFHPTFLYESVLDIINFLVLIVLFKRLQACPPVAYAPGVGRRATSPTRLTGGHGGRTSYQPDTPDWRSWRAGQLKKGTISFVYLFNYAVIRILMEQLRTDTAPEFFGVRVPIIVSMVMMVISIGALILVYKKRRTS